MSNEARDRITRMWTDSMGAHADTAFDALITALSEHRDGKDIDIAERASDVGFDATAAPAWRERAVETFNDILATLPTPTQGEG